MATNSETEQPKKTSTNHKINLLSDIMTDWIKVVNRLEKELGKQNTKIAAEVKKVEEQFNADLKNAKDELGKKSTELEGEVKKVEEQFNANLKTVKDELGKKSTELEGEVKKVEEQFNANLKTVKDELSGDIQAIHNRIDEEVGDAGSDDNLPRRPDISETLYSPMNLDTASGF